MFGQARFVVGMPQVTQAEICPKLVGLLRDSLNLDLTAPDHLDTMPCPLIMKGMLLEMSFHLKRVYPIEGISVY